jgi:steroid delta-isomerase-like uncharacterized protein
MTDQNDDATVTTVRRALEEIWNTGQVDDLDDLLADAYVRHGNDEDTDKEHIKSTITSSRTAFPDLNTRIQHIVQQGDLVATHWKCTGTHDGPFYDLPVTHKKVVIVGMTFSRIADGKIAEEWESWSGADLFKTLGVVNLWEAR